VTGTSHMGVHRGKRVLVRMRDGTKFIDWFEDRTDRHLVLRNSGKVPKVQVKSMSYYRGDR
jgi:hypothetical protein